MRRGKLSQSTAGWFILCLGSLVGIPALFAGEQLDGMGSADTHYDPLLQELDPLSQELGVLSQELCPLSQELCPLSQELDVPMLVEVADVHPDQMTQLELIAKPASSNRRVNPNVTRGVVLQLCTGRYLGVRVLAHLLSKDPNDLVRRFLTPLVNEGVLRRAFPRPNDPRQVYTKNPTNMTKGKQTPE